MSGRPLSTAVSRLCPTAAAVRGSTLKPFIYALGGPSDRRTRCSRTRRYGWGIPAGKPTDFYGPLSATEALVRSRNVPAVALLERLSKPTLFQFLRQAGLRFSREEAYYGLALAMGGAELSMEDLLRLYALLANGGEWRELRWLSGGRPGTHSCVSPFTLRKPPFSCSNARNNRAPTKFRRSGLFSAGRLEDRPPPVSGSWAVVAGDLLVSVVAGSTVRLIVGCGRELASPLLFIIQAVALERRRRAPARSASWAQERRDLPVSGALRSPWCPHGKKGWIIRGVSPIRQCTVHRLIYVDPASGLRLCRGDEARGRPRVAEFWDSDELDLFRLAGVRRDVPPPFEKPCEDLAGGDAGAGAPRILSPQADANYPIRTGEANPIEFSAVASGGRHRLFWFVDDAYVGEGPAISWPGKPGRHTVRVVDDQGLSATTRLIGTPAD